MGDPPVLPSPLPLPPCTVPRPSGFPFTSSMDGWASHPSPTQTLPLGRTRGPGTATAQRPGPCEQPLAPTRVSPRGLGSTQILTMASPASHVPTSLSSSSRWKGNSTHTMAPAARRPQQLGPPQEPRQLQPGLPDTIRSSSQARHPLTQCQVERQGAEPRRARAAQLAWPCRVCRACAQDQKKEPDNHLPGCTVVPAPAAGALRRRGQCPVGSCWWRRSGR